MIILGVHYGHNATVALVKDGRLVFCMSEERFNRLKNSNGFPILTLRHVYENYIKPEQVDFAVLSQKTIAGYVDLKARGLKSVRDFGLGNVNFNKTYNFKNYALSRLPIYYKLRSLAGRLRLKLLEKTLAKEAAGYYSQCLQLPREKILFCAHHDAHALACCFNLPDDRATLIFTMDGEGDGESSTVQVWDGKNLNKLSSNPVAVSLGYFFTEITKYLGMTPNEHEFKVMGLAPYAKQEKAGKLYEKLKDILILNENLEFESKYDTRRLEFFLQNKLYGQRFDTIAAFAQIFLEEKALEWVKSWIKKTGIRQLALGGGVFMSVKLNQKILELPEVVSLFIMPSAADESTAIGAAFFGNKIGCEKTERKFQSVPFADLYLGNEYSDAEIEKYSQDSESFGKFQVQKFTQEFALEKKLAELLSQNQVVARFKGRSEWGARALGNRSILANAADRDAVRIINEMIKNRDFWMPFAASILEEDQECYLINPKKIAAPYMAITFNTTPLAREHLPAAIHPYDFTCRPQVVYKDWNPAYHALILEYKRLTGRGGILNTSFNLHGEPNVESPQDALRTFENSGLKFLAIDQFLVSKKI